MNFTSEDLVELGNLAYKTKCAVQITDEEDEKSVYLRDEHGELYEWAEDSDSVQVGLNHVGNELLQMIRGEYNWLFERQAILAPILFKYVNR